MRQGAYNQNYDQSGNSITYNNKPTKASARIYKYLFDMKDPVEYFENKKNNPFNGYSCHTTQSSTHTDSADYQLKWYENQDWTNKLIYKIEKSIPGVVQRILEEMGFIEWDEKEHDADQWNILWKSQR